MLLFLCVGGGRGLRSVKIISLILNRANCQEGRKRKIPEKKKPDHLQAEFGSSHMWPELGSNQQQWDEWFRALKISGLFCHFCLHGLQPFWRTCGNPEVWQLLPSCSVSELLALGKMGDLIKSERSNFSYILKVCFFFFFFLLTWTYQQPFWRACGNAEVWQLLPSCSVCELLALGKMGDLIKSERSNFRYILEQCFQRNTMPPTIKCPKMRPRAMVQTSFFGQNLKFKVLVWPWKWGQGHSKSTCNHFFPMSEWFFYARLVKIQVTKI